MANVHNLKDYKKANVYVTHLQAILKVIDLSIRGLTMFEVYTPVGRILTNLKNEKIVLEAHLTEQKRILKERGRTNE